MADLDMPVPLTLQSVSTKGRLQKPPVHPGRNTCRPTSTAGNLSQTTRNNKEDPLSSIVEDNRSTPSSAIGDCVHCSDNHIAHRHMHDPGENQQILLRVGVLPPFHVSCAGWCLARPVSQTAKSLFEPKSFAEVV